MKNIDCFKCRHFYVTWEPQHPRGCKAFGFKTAKMPSQVVLETSGQPCMKFQPKPRQNDSDSPQNGWIA